MRKKIVALILSGLSIIVTWSFFGILVETEVPILNVDDQWTYGEFYGEFTKETGLVEYPRILTIVGTEDFEGVPCYVCINEYQHTEHINRTEITWITSDWVVLKTEEMEISSDEGFRIVHIYNPGIILYDFPLSVGKEWSGKSNRTIESYGWDASGEKTYTYNGSDQIDWARRIVSTETITVPAGTFDTYVVEELKFSMGKIFWFSSDVKTHVKIQYSSIGGGGIVLTNYELISQENEQGDLPLIMALSAAIGVLGVTFFLYDSRNQDTKARKK